jgi:hypothetical protein
MDLPFFLMNISVVTAVAGLGIAQFSILTGSHAISCAVIAGFFITVVIYAIFVKAWPTLLKNLTRYQSVGGTGAGAAKPF